MIFYDQFNQEDGMGWLTTWLDGKTPKEYLDKNFTFNNSYSSSEVVVSRMVGSQYYAAIKHTTDKRTVVVAVVCLTKKYQNEFSYKDMDETMLPYQYKCPSSILNLLTPIEQLRELDFSENEIKNMIEWREQCRKLTSKKPLKVGDLIQFVHPIEFTDGHKCDSFRVSMRTSMTNGRHNAVYISLGNGLPYYIRKVNQRDYKILPNLLDK